MPRRFIESSPIRTTLGSPFLASLLVATGLLLQGQWQFADAAAPRIDAPFVSYTVGSGPSCVAAGNFDGVSPPDLAVANQSGNSVSILLARGGGSFNEKVDYPVGGLAPLSVAIADLNGDGRQDLVTANGSSSNVSVLLGNGDGTFAAPSTFAVGLSPISVAIDNLDADAKPDLAVANNMGSSISILLGNGDGTFQPKTDYATGTNPNFVAIARLNSGAALDLVTANAGANTVSVLLGNGDGTFGLKSDMPSGGSMPRWVAVGDYTGDGAADLAVANEGTGAPGTAGIGILIGNGTGSFIDAWGAPYATDGAPTSVALGDLDGDGKLDLVATNSMAQSVAVRFRYPSPNPPPPYFYASPIPSDFDFGGGRTPSCAALADLSGDGRLDIVVVNRNFDAVTLLFNHQTGGSTSAWFEGGHSYPLDGIALGCAIGQLDGVGPPDVAVAMYFGTMPTDYVATLLMNGDGTLGSVHATETAPGPNSIAIGSLNGSPPPDLAVSCVSGSPPNMSILPGNGDGTFGARSDLSIGGDCWSVAMGDLDGDGDSDLAGTVGAGVGILLGHGDGTFAAAVYYPSGVVTAASDGIAIGQLDGSGPPDLAVANLNDNTVSGLPGIGSGAFGPYTSYAVGLDPYWVAIGDFNGDGNSDIATADYGSNAVSVLIADGLGSFSRAVPYATGGSPNWIAVGDMDGDGNQDLVTANVGGDGSVTVLPGHGDGTFGLKVDFGTGRVDLGTGQFLGGYSVAIGDLNSDGRSDLAVTASTPGRVLLLSGLGPTASGVAGEGAPPAQVRLAARPNPGAGSATFSFSLPKAGRVRLEIFDVAGRLVATPLNSEREAGPVNVAWTGRGRDGTPLASGVYIVRLNVAGEETSRKIVWAR